jgi:Icc-related predicted phosphoesterase
VSTVRVAAVGDLHQRVNAPGVLAQLVDGARDLNALALCGDLTDRGLPEEAEALAQELRGLALPVVAVLGNHDYESGHGADVRRILIDAGIQVLDGEACEIAGVGFAGAKGFAGGFGARALGAFGEDAIKQFVREAVDEALKLESALARLRTRTRVALLHYAPIEGTVRGEPEQIYPFLGSYLLAEAIDTAGADLAIHGHAHAGTEAGVTPGGVPVRNVAQPVIKRAYNVYCFSERRLSMVG